MAAFTINSSLSITATDTAVESRGTLVNSSLGVTAAITIPGSASFYDSPGFWQYNGGGGGLVLQVKLSLQPLRYGWQAKQFKLDPNRQYAASPNHTLNSLANPAASGVTALAVNPVEEHTDEPLHTQTEG
jgi:hypothetical protein